MGILQEEKGVLGRRGQIRWRFSHETADIPKHLHAISRHAANPSLHFLPHSLVRPGSQALPAPLLQCGADRQVASSGICSLQAAPASTQNQVAALAGVLLLCPHGPVKVV